MKCPYCYVPESKVIDSRPADNGMSIKRRRECSSCGRKFNTYEKVEDIPLRVIKKDGSRQSFEKSKVMNGVTRACEKRPVSSEQIENLVNQYINEDLKCKIEYLSKEEEQILLGICSYMRGRHIFVVYVTNYTISCICIYFYLLFDNFLHMFKCADMDLLNVLYGIVHAFAYLLPSDWCIVTFRMLG